jgi:ketosteroid isomerase-like protein
MAEHPNVELLRRGYAAFETGDMETLRSELFAPDIVWHHLGDNPMAGEYEGPEQVIGLFLNTRRERLRQGGREHARLGDAVVRPAESGALTEHRCGAW